MSALTLALSMLVPFTSYAGGNSGGGGGGICLTNNKCITLAQAGFRIKNLNERNYSPLITEEVIAELEAILAIFPKQVNLKPVTVLGEEGDIVDVEISDAKKLAVFLQDYKTILEANGATDLAKTVELMAFTASVETSNSFQKKSFTYLIKGKFDSLNPRGRALTLIHEYLLRLGFPLKDVISLDGSILDYLKAVENNQKPDLVGLIKLTEKISPRYKYYTNSYMMNEALDGKPLLLTNLDIQFSPVRREFYDIVGITSTLSFYEIQKLKKTYPKMKFVKEDEEIITPGGGREAGIQDFKSYLLDIADASPSKKVKVTNAMFDQFLKENGDSNFKLCGDKTDYRSWFVPSTDEGFQFPRLIGCRIDSSDPLTVNLNGVNLGLQKDLTCTIKDFSLSCK